MWKRSRASTKPQHSGASRVHVSKVVEGEDMTRLGSQVEILDGHLEVLSHTPSIVVHIAQM